MRLTTERILFYLFCILSASPLLFSHYPPMVDIPQHAAVIATLNNLALPDFPYHDLYYLDWMRPYLGGYLILWGVSQFLPILLAVKLLIAAAVIAIPITASRLRAHFGGDVGWDWLLLPISYGMAFQWGFFNFIIGAPIVLLFLLSAFKFSETPSLRTGIWLTFFAHSLLLIHLLVAAFGCGLAFLYVIARKSQWKQKILTGLPFISPLPVVIIYLFVWVSSSGLASGEGSWDLSIYRPFQFLSSAVGLPANNSNAAIGFLFFALPFLLGARLTNSRPRQAVFVAYLLWMMFGPNYILGTFFTYNRFALFGIPMLFLVISKPSSTTRSEKYDTLLRSLLFILPVTLIIFYCFRFASFDDESKGYRDIETKMQPHKRVLGLIYNNQSPVFGNLPTYMHFASWYQAEHSGVTDFSFSQFGLLVRYKPDAAVAIPRGGFSWRPDSFDWNLHKGWLYDYFVVRNEGDISSHIFRTAECPVKYVTHSGSWWLYETELGDANDPRSCAAKRIAENQLK